MSKMKNRKSDNKLNDNEHTFVKQNASFHPAESNIKEQAFVDNAASSAMQNDEKEKYYSINERSNNLEHLPKGQEQTENKKSEKTIVSAITKGAINGLHRILKNIGKKLNQPKQ